MKTRFEMPVSVDDTLKQINLFAVDDYLRLIQSEGDRRRLILRLGYSPEKRRAYEKRHQLPRGALEVAMMMEDSRFKELNALLVRQLTRATGESAKPADLAEFYQRANSISVGLAKLYPEAQDFFLQHWLLSQSNHRHFLGDHRFSNEYRLQLVSSWCPSLSPVNCNILVNLGILLNVGIIANVGVGLNVIAAANIGVYLNVAAAVFLFAWAAVCFFAAGWPALYGPNTQSLR
ncbi:MAG TPA: hypothetical protein PLX89_06360 [Verrucomicrobiota bacterium]|nr:hypothetical protein [Verrucomicrobiales bacterium]HRI12613.1 hypothetical protein [Verrucomicrobiota bacterium]